MTPRPDLSKAVPDRAPCVSYFTPKQPAVAGSYRSGVKSKLFSSLEMRNITLPNRIGVSPMCTYSAEDGVATDWHLAHYAQYAMRGPSLTVLESVAISPEGRITPHCLGIYTEEQRTALKRIVDFYHSQGKIIGIQLSHAGYRASCLPLYFDKFDCPVPNELGGWLDNVWGPSPNDEFGHAKEMTIQDISVFVDQFRRAVQWSVDCEFDFIEIHAAHGFMINQFMSPLGNKRKDSYGGSLENRTRILRDVLQAASEVRAASREFPIWVRISASDNDENNVNSWRLRDSLELAPLLVQLGVDLIDVSSGGMAPAKAPHIPQTEMAQSVKQVVGDSCLVSAVGGIWTGKRAEHLLQQNYCDLCLAGRGFLKDPGLVENMARDLGVEVQMNLQDGWCFGSVWTESSKV